VILLEEKDIHISEIPKLKEKDGKTSISDKDYEKTKEILDGNQKEISIDELNKLTETFEGKHFKKKSAFFVIFTKPLETIDFKIFGVKDLFIFNKEDEEISFHRLYNDLVIKHKNMYLIFQRKLYNNKFIEDILYLFLTDKNIQYVIELFKEKNREEIIEDHSSWYRPINKIVKLSFSFEDSDTYFSIKQPGSTIPKYIDIIGMTSHYYENNILYDDEEHTFLTTGRVFNGKDYDCLGIYLDKKINKEEHIQIFKNIIEMGITPYLVLYKGKSGELKYVVYLESSSLEDRFSLNWNYNIPNHYSWNVNEIKEFLKKKGIKTTSSLRKNELLILAIKNL
jgi:hypothetical protein